MSSVPQHSDTSQHSGLNQPGGLRQRKFWLVCLLAYSVLLAAVSLLPGGAAAPLKWDAKITPTMQDIGHVPAYAILVILALCLARASRGLTVAKSLIIFMACCGYGAMLEAGQWFIPGRTCSMSDALANAAGAAAGLAGFAVWRGYVAASALRRKRCLANG